MYAGQTETLFDRHCLAVVSALPFLRQRTQAMLCKNRDSIGRADLVGGQVVNSEMGFREMMLLMLAAASLVALVLMAVAL
jgi:hypothetical protein